MKHNTVFTVLAALLLTWAVVLIGPQGARAATITVPDDYPTIQQAVDAAASGDTVSVRAGTYTEHVTIGKTLTLQGEDRQTTIVDGSGSGDVLYVTADGVAISGFTIRNGTRGIYLYQADNCTFDDLLITSNTSRGMFLRASTYNTVTNSVVTDNNQGIDMGHEGSHHNTFQNIDVYSNTIVGLDGWAGSHNVTILDSRLHDNPRGVEIGWSRNWIIENTAIFSNSNVGIYIDTGDYATVKNCEIYLNTQGVRFTGFHADHHEFVGNRIHANIESGLMFNNDARYNIVKENEIFDNGVGVHMNESPSRPSYANTFCHNRFVNNTTHALVENNGNNPNTWDCGYPSGGNVWDDYTGVDVKSGPNQDQPGSDGIGDTPYVIPSTTSTTNIDRYPLYPSSALEASKEISGVDRIAATPIFDVFAGDTFTYTIKVENPFEQAVYVMVSDTLDLYLEYVWDSFVVDGTPAGNDAFASGDLLYPDHLLNTGETLSLSFDVQVQDVTPIGWIFENIAAITAYLDPLNIPGTTLTVVEAIAPQGQVIPEPSTLLLLGIGVIGGAALRWRTRRKKP